MSRSISTGKTILGLCAFCCERVEEKTLRKVGVNSFCKSCYPDVAMHPDKYAKYVYDCGYNTCSSCPVECEHQK
ncbi:MAG: hypothetical protein ACXAB7_06165 [Candidatus Kariarchaeaceae archaeon]